MAGSRSSKADALAAGAATKGWEAMRASSRPISPGGRTKSTAPVATALCGMPLWTALSSWAKVMPPAVLISWMPTVPSLAVPESTMPIALWPCSSASERMKWSTGRCTPRSSVRGASCSRPWLNTMSLPGGITYTLSGDTCVLFSTSSTGSGVARCRISASMLSCFGSRCCTRTKPMPVRCGSAASSALKASSPPAEAPIATIGKSGLSSGVRWPGTAGFTPGMTGSAASRRGLRAERGFAALRVVFGGIE